MIKRMSTNATESAVSKTTYRNSKHHFPVAFVGHPLIDAIQNQLVDATTFRRENQLDQKP
jgi:lipid-A-disaccharide synthase